MNEEIIEQRIVEFIENSFIELDDVPAGTVFFLESDMKEYEAKALRNFMSDDPEYFAKVKIGLPGGPSHAIVANYFIRKYGYVSLGSLNDRQFKCLRISNRLKSRILFRGCSVIIVKRLDKVYV